MKLVTHTPGPWRFRAPPPSGDLGNPWVVLDRDSHVLAIVPRSPREANARLIAAAPEMYAALVMLIHNGPMPTTGREKRAFKNAAEVIAKAEGRQS